MTADRTRTRRNGKSLHERPTPPMDIGFYDAAAAVMCAIAVVTRDPDTTARARRMVDDDSTFGLIMRACTAIVRAEPRTRCDASAAALAAELADLDRSRRLFTVGGTE